MRTLFIAITLIAALGGCDTVRNAFGRNDGADPLRIESVGVETKESLKGKPKELVGDEANSLYGFDELRPAATEEEPPL